MHTCLKVCLTALKLKGAQPHTPEPLRSRGKKNHDINNPNNNNKKKTQGKSTTMQKENIMLCPIRCPYSGIKLMFPLRALTKEKGASVMPPMLPLHGGAISLVEMGCSAE